jgi:hypothetical protein
MGDINRKILVLGSDSHGSQVTAYKWDALPADLNVADYDVVILNFEPFMKAQFVDVAHRPAIQWDGFPGPRDFANLLFSDGSEVIVIGTIGGNSFLENPPRTITWWLPFYPEFTMVSGNVFTVSDTDFGFYFEHVKHWKFYVIDSAHQAEGHAEYLAALRHKGAPIECRITPIAVTRNQQFISFALQFAIQGKASSKIYWLPLTTSIPLEDAVNLILKDRFGLSQTSSEPVWALSYVLPRQIPVEKKIAKLEAQRNRVEQDLAKTNAELPRVTYFRQLLYEQHDALEDVVEAALRELRGVVSKGQAPEKEDRRLKDPKGRDYIVEIKGRTKPLQGIDVTQLYKWVGEAVAEDPEWEGKPLLVANMQCNLPLEERTDRFPDSAVKTAKRFNQCILPTTQLFQAIVDHQNKILDYKEFWDTLNSTIGVTALREPDPH